MMAIMRNACLAMILSSYASTAAGECKSDDMRSVLQDRNPSVVKTLEEGWALAYARRDAALLNCILADGKSEDRHLQAGASFWSDGGKGIPENLGDQPFELI